MKTIERKLVKDALNNANIREGEDGDASIREEYSGRGMYNRTCFGVTFNRESDSYKFLVSLALILAKEGEDDQAPYVLAAAATTDSMGTGMILYFPGFTLED